MVKERFKQKAQFFDLPAPALAFFTITRIPGTQNLEVEKGEETEPPILRIYSAVLRGLQMTFRLFPIHWL